MLRLFRGSDATAPQQPVARNCGTKDNGHYREKSRGLARLTRSGKAASSKLPCRSVVTTTHYIMTLSLRSHYCPLSFRTFTLADILSPADMDCFMQGGLVTLTSTAASSAAAGGGGSGGVRYVTVLPDFKDGVLVALRRSATAAADAADVGAAAGARALWAVRGPPLPSSSSSAAWWRKEGRRQQAKPWVVLILQLLSGILAEKDNWAMHLRNYVEGLCFIDSFLSQHPPPTSSAPRFLSCDSSSSLGSQMRCGVPLLRTQHQQYAGGGGGQEEKEEEEPLAVAYVRLCRDSHSGGSVDGGGEAAGTGGAAATDDGDGHGSGDGDETAEGGDSGRRREKRGGGGGAAVLRGEEDEEEGLGPLIAVPLCCVLRRGASPLHPRLQSYQPPASCCCGAVALG